MSWLKEVEGAITKQKGEQAKRIELEKSRKEQERRENRRRWEAYKSQVIDKLIANWQDLEIGSILRDVRDLISPTSKISYKIVLPIKGSELILNRGKRVVEKRGILFKPKEVIRFWRGDWRPSRSHSGSYEAREFAKESPDMVEVLMNFKVHPEDIKDPHIKASVIYWTSSSYRGSDGDLWEKYKPVYVFNLTLHEDRIAFDEKVFPLDQVGSADALKKKIAQSLKGRYDS